MSDMVPDRWGELLGELHRRRAAALAMGGTLRVEREHAAGRMSARERIAALLDEGSFEEFGTLATTPMDSGDRAPSTLICGLGLIDGRPVAVAAEDFTVQGGGVGVHLRKFKGSWGGFIEEFALGYEIPLVMLMQGVGASVAAQQEKGYPELLAGLPLFPMFELLDRVPVVAAVLGPTAGGSAARVAMTHFSVMTRENGCLFAGGPPLVKQALGLTVDKFELGGVDVHTKVSGLVDNAASGEADALAQLRTVLSLLPSSTSSLAARALNGDPADRRCDEVLDVVPPRLREAYDAQALIRAVVDRDTFFEIAPDFGRSVRVGLARMDGWVVGVLASDARFLAGAMDADSSAKQARFVEMCDRFHVPLAYFADVPGFMIGPEAERSGVLRAGVEAVRSIHRASVPVWTVQVRRSYGLAGHATGNNHPNSVRLTWPSGSWGDMPVTGGIEAVYGAEIAAADDPIAAREAILERMRAQTDIWRTVEKFGVEEMIDPRETRQRLCSLAGLHYRAAGSRLGVGSGEVPR